MSWDQNYDNSAYGGDYENYGDFRQRGDHHQQQQQQQQQQYQQYQQQPQQGQQQYQGYVRRARSGTTCNYKKKREFATLPLNLQI